MFITPNRRKPRLTRSEVVPKGEPAKCLQKKKKKELISLGNQRAAEREIGERVSESHACYRDPHAHVGQNRSEKTIIPKSRSHIMNRALIGGSNIPKGARKLETGRAPRITGAKVEVPSEWAYTPSETGYHRHTPSPAPRRRRPPPARRNPRRTPRSPRRPRDRATSRARPCPP